jgi:hypothetical protein
VTFQPHQSEDRTLSAGPGHEWLVGEAVANHPDGWPERLTSGVMFWKGERITRAEFQEEWHRRGDRERNDRKNSDPYRQAEADRWLGREG